MSREIIDISEKSDFSLLRIFSPAATSYALLKNYRRTWGRKWSRRQSKNYTSVAVSFPCSMLIFDILPEVFVSYAATLLNLFFSFVQEDLEFGWAMGHYPGGRLQ